MLSVLLVLASNLAPTLQEPPPQTLPVTPPATEASRPSPRSKLPENDPQAVEFLAKLVAAQRVSESLPDVEFFAMEVELREFGEERGNELELRLDYDSRDGSFRLAVNDVDYGQRIFKGWHPAHGYWLVDPEMELIRLDAKEFQNDRKLIDETLSFCEDFLLLFDLSRLQRKAGGMKLEERENDRVLKGVMRRSGRALWKFELAVANDSLLPYQLVLFPPELAKDDTESESDSDPSDRSEAATVDDAGAQQAENEAAEAAKPKPMIYLFESWTEQSGRKLPEWIDEFDGAQPDVLIRALSVNGFVWREAAIVSTAPPRPKPNNEADDDSSKPQSAEGN